MATRAMPSHNGPPPKSAQSLGAPNQTLYCTNLPDKLQKQDLRLSIYTLFSTYGPVLDVVALKTMKMRGQAHVVFRDVQASTQALRALQGFDFFGKEMKIQYAKSKSDTIAKLDGTYRMPAVTAGAVTSTELQQSIFNAPPSSLSAPPPSAVSSLKPPDTATNGVKSDTDGPQGVKRRRDDESDGEDAPMEEDDSDAPMEASSDED
ncbi:MAG: U2 snRNP complex subunit msl1 [Pleopsidium flavum]|nr:MAG: U2 snRNP complex subunit msl1 [Pleopsidium flavum]